jgi:sodium/potassium-transporting ATPase subunit alpha
MLEHSCHAGFFFSIVAVQWVNLIACRTQRDSVFQKGMWNHVMNFALLFETLLAILLIYVPGINTGLQMEMVHPWHLCFPWLPFALLLFTYDELRKATMRKHRGGWLEQETCF